MCFALSIYVISGCNKETLFKVVLSMVCNKHTCNILLSVNCHSKNYSHLKEEEIRRIEHIKTRL